MQSLQFKKNNNMKAFYQTKPSKNAFVALGGEIAICIDWQAVQEKIGDNTVNGFGCMQLNFRDTELANDVAIERFVREKYSQSEEFALINAYQASVTGIAKDAEKEQEYRDFLTWRESMRTQVKAALADYTASKQTETQTETES